MFNWLKRKNPPTESPSMRNGDPGEPLIAALLLDTPTLDLTAAHAAIAAGTFSGAAPGDLRVDRGILSFSVGDEMLFVAPMPAPYPWSDLEGPCQTSWMWPKERPATALKTHKSHVLVTGMRGTANGIARRMLLTQVVARLANLPGVAGIYWPDATLVHHPPIFAEMAGIASADAPPLYLWVDPRVVRERDGTFTCFTTGLAALGLMEMEITGLTMPPGDLRDWAINIAAYMLDRGAPIPHGDTIGATADEKLRVTHGPSRFGAPGKVMRFGVTS